MTLQSFLVFLPAILSGSLLIHLLWPEREPAALLLKASLGAGLGLGLASILYFISLLLMPGKVNLLPVTLAVLAALGIVVLLRERGQRWDVPRMPLLCAPPVGAVCGFGAGGGFYDANLREPRHGTASGCL